MLSTFFKSMTIMVRIIPDTFSILYRSIRHIFVAINKSIRWLFTIAKNGLLFVQNVLSAIIFIGIRISLQLSFILLPAVLYFDVFGLVSMTDSALGNQPWFDNALNYITIASLLFSVIFIFTLSSQFLKNYNQENEKIDWRGYRDILSNTISWIIIIAILLYSSLIKITYIYPQAIKQIKNIGVPESLMPSAYRELYIRSDCKEKVFLSLKIQKWPLIWEQLCCWDIEGKTEGRLLYNELPILVRNPEIYIYAEASSLKVFWNGIDHNDKMTGVIHGRSADLLRIDARELGEGRYRIDLNCAQGG